MVELAQENLSRAQCQQKLWYDRNARSRTFQPGDQVLMLLPSSTSKVLAQWQGPHLHVVTRRVGNDNYEVNMFDKQKRQQVFHVNTLHQWRSPVDLASLTTEVMDSGEDSDDNVVAWDGDGRGEQPTAGKRLDHQQRVDLQHLLKEYDDIL